MFTWDTWKTFEVLKLDFYLSRLTFHLLIDHTSNKPDWIDAIFNTKREYSSQKRVTTPIRVIHSRSIISKRGNIYQLQKSIYFLSNFEPMPIPCCVIYNYLLFWKCCSGRLVFPPIRTFSSLQHIFDQIRLITSW